jgi:hypothetical protein
MSVGVTHLAVLVSSIFVAVAVEASVVGATAFSSRAYSFFEAVLTGAPVQLAVDEAIFVQRGDE